LGLLCSKRRQPLDLPEDTYSTPTTSYLLIPGRAASIISSLFPLGPNLYTVNVSHHFFGPDVLQFESILVYIVLGIRPRRVAKIRVLNIGEQGSS
jgi:hypothetical protein